MTQILATNAQGRMVIADSSEAKALGYTPVNNSQPNPKGAASTSSSTAPENNPLSPTLGTSAAELIAIAKAGGGTLQTIGSTYEIKPTKEAVQNQQTVAVSKAVGEPVKYGGGQSNVQHGEGVVYYGASGTQYFYSPDQGKIYWNKGQANTSQPASKTTLPTSNNTYYNPFKNESFTITTKTDYIQQGEMARLTYQANNLSPAELLAYTVWSMPYNIEPLIQGAIVRYGGGTPEETKRAVFEAGPLAFKMQAYYNPIQFIETMALKSLFISLPATNLISPGVASLTTVAVGTYDISRKSMENKLDIVSAGVDLTMIGLGAAGVYSSMSEFLGRTPVDPILKDIDVKGFHESAEEIPQQKYVPILGKEYVYAQNQENLNVQMLSEKAIYGKPQDVPVELKDFDNLIKLNIREDEPGMIKTSEVVFKVTDQGVEPSGGATRTEFIPYERHPFFHVLDSLGPEKIEEWQLNAYQLKEINFEATKPVLNIIEAETGPGTSRIVDMKVIGIEKPTNYVVDIMQSPNKAGPWITTGDALGVETTQKVNEFTIPIDLTHGPLSLDLASGKGVVLKWLTDEDYLKETVTPIGQEILETTPRHVVIDTGNEGPTKVFIPQVGWVPTNERENKGRQDQYNSGVDFTKNPNTNIMINTGRGEEKETPIDFTGVVENNFNKTLNNQSDAQMSGQFQNQQMKQLQFEIQTNSTIFREVSVNVSQPTQESRSRERPDEDKTLPGFKGGGGSPMKFIIINSAGMKKTLNVVSLNLPTASDMSLEKAFSKYGHASLARGPKAVKAYREQASTYGLGSVGFPAAELIKRYRGGKKK